MYKYDHHTNIPWNVAEYHTPRLELNADLEIQKRKWDSQKKGVPDNKHVTKRGYYMDYAYKVAKGIPSSVAHGSLREWESERLKKIGQNNKIDSKLLKYSYLDQIEIEQKNRKSPGICSYSLEKSMKQKDEEIEKLKKRKQSVGEKVVFYMNTEKLSDISPGPGGHSPHLSSPTMRENKNDYKYWVEKHKKEGQVIAQRDAIKPASGTYSPMNITLSTFEKLQKDSGKPATKRNYFGLDSKFEYTRPDKKKIVEKRPAPSSYTTTHEWKGKDVSPKKSDLNVVIWKGRSNSVYH